MYKAIRTRYGLRPKTVGLTNNVGSFGYTQTKSATVQSIGFSPDCGSRAAENLVDLRRQP